MSQKQREAPPDARQLAQQALPESPFPGGRNAPFRAYMDPAIQLRIGQHATEDVSVEICGVLVGKWARDADGPYVHVLESIRGDAAASKFAEVTFTHETWARINQQMDTRFTQLAIVGWYHSHPSFGIFLSDRDRFIQEHFFSGAGQIAYVIDPVRKTEGIFLWRNGKPQLCPHFWVGDRIQVSTPVGEEGPTSAKAELPAANHPPAASSGKESPPWTNWAVHAAMFLMVFMLGYFLANKLTDLDRLRIEQGALARSLVYFSIRPGLREDLARVNIDLQETAKAATALSQEHLKLLDEPQEARSRWNEVLQRLDHSSKRLTYFGMYYSPTPQEVAPLMTMIESKPKPSGKDQSAPKEEKAEKQEKQEGTNSKPEEKKP